MKATIDRVSEIHRSPRVHQLEGLFDVPPSQRSAEHWDVDLPIEDRPWNIGLIVGSSGCGKSTIARELFGEAVCSGFEWGAGSIVDGFPAAMGIKDITALLSSVGFSSPPLWLRPYGVLSTGQQMRVTMARLLADNRPIAVMDEFTSVVDRTVAQLGSAAIAKSVRRRDQKFIAVTCHFDVEEWLQPDWVYRPESGAFAWRSLQRRPAIELEVARVHHKAWDMFKPYHYLSAELHHSARCFVGFYCDQPIGFVAVLSVPGIKDRFRFSRVVTLPDYQGVGVGMALFETIGSAYRGIGCRITNSTSLSGLLHAYERSPNWRISRPPSRSKPVGRTSSIKAYKAATQRLVGSAEYVGPIMDATEAAAFTGKTDWSHRGKRRKNPLQMGPSPVGGERL